MNYEKTERNYEQEQSVTWTGEMPKCAAIEVLDCGETDTITAFPLLILDRNSSKPCFSSITVSADVTHPLYYQTNKL